MFDSHCHYLLPSHAGGITMGTRPGDWSKFIANLSACLDASGAAHFVGLGVHPWFVSEVNDISETMNALEQFLITYPNMIIGEIGIDLIKTVLQLLFLYTLGTRKAMGFI